MRHLLKTCLASAALCILAAGCSSSSPATSDQKSGPAGVDRGQPTASDNLNKPVADVAKTCAIPPPAKSAATSTNAEGKEYPYPTSKISTSQTAIPFLWAEAKKWSADAKLRGNYHGSGSSYTPTDPKGRAHFGSARGAEWAWDATFYSPSKKQEIYLGYIDGEIGGSIPQAVHESVFAADEKSGTSIYTDTDDMIDSCVVYELAKAHGFDEQANYHIYMTGNAQSGSEKYRNRKTWKVEERSRTDTDGGREIMGKVVNSYLFDAVTGEFLEKVEGRTYSF